jgi:spore coat polysaccharide biosynthesis protein SpsF
VSGRVVAVIQARTGSSRLPGKVLADIAGLPLVVWTIRATLAVQGLDAVILATTEQPEDDELARLAGGLVAVHRGSVHDVLTRVWEAAAPLDPAIVVRQTADNPFPDPAVVAMQVDALVEGGFDFVGNAGWPLGIAAEVARAGALQEACTEAVDPAEREHVMPFLYARPERYRIGRLAAPPAAHPRYTVDTDADLALARILADRIGHEPPVSLAELEAVIAADPAIGGLNVGVRQKGWREVDERAPSGA